MTNSHDRLLGNRALSPETLMMGYGYDPFLSERSLKPPVFHTSTFVFRSAQDGKEFFELAYGLRQKRPNEEPGLIYSRINNPDLEMLEDRLAIWDQAEASLVFASGMAAISTTLWAYARPSSRARATITAGRSSSTSGETANATSGSSSCGERNCIGIFWTLRTASMCSPRENALVDEPESWPGSDLRNRGSQGQFYIMRLTDKSIFN